MCLNGDLRPIIRFLVTMMGTGRRIHACFARGWAGFRATARTGRFAIGNGELRAMLVPPVILMVTVAPILRSFDHRQGFGSFLRVPTIPYQLLNGAAALPNRRWVIMMATAKTTSLFGTLDNFGTCCEVRTAWSRFLSGV